MTVSRVPSGLCAHQHPSCTTAGPAASVSNARGGLTGLGAPAPSSALPSALFLTSQHRWSCLMPAGILLGLTFSLLVSTVWPTWGAGATV